MSNRASPATLLRKSLHNKLPHWGIFTRLYTNLMQVSPALVKLCVIALKITANETAFQRTKPLLPPRASRPPSTAPSVPFRTEWVPTLARGVALFFGLTGIIRKVLINAPLPALGRGLEDATQENSGKLCLLPC